MAFAPFIKNAKIKIDGVAYDDEVENVTITPTTSTQSFTPISGKSISDSQVTGWNCAFTYGVDVDNQTSLARAIHSKSAGATVPESDIEVIFEPTNNASGSAIKVTLPSLMPGSMGGAAGVHKATSTSPCNRPVFVPKPVA